MRSFRNSDEVITGEDKPKTIKGQFTSDYPMGLGVRHTFIHDFEIRIKDGAAKIIIDHISNVDPSVMGGPYSAETYWKKKDGTLRENEKAKALDALRQNCKDLAVSLQKAIIKSGDDF